MISQVDVIKRSQKSLRLAFCRVEKEHPSELNPHCSLGSLGSKARTDNFAKVLFSVKTTPMSWHCLISEGSSACYCSKINLRGET